MDSASFVAPVYVASILFFEVFGFRLGVALHIGALCQAVLFSSVVMMRCQFFNLALSFISTMKVYQSET
jgi:hypothetical protein